MGCTAALQTRQIVQNVEHILALELLAAAQGVDFRKQNLNPQAQLGRGTQPAYDLIRQHVPFLEQDAVMYPYIEAVRQLIAGSELVKATNRAVQDVWDLEHES
jgi:histidine ammonia-lyase